MSISRKKTKDNSVLAFDGDITIYTVSQLKEAIFSEPENLSKNIALDLQSVTEIDTAGVQLLLAVQKIFSATGKQVSIGKSNDLVDAVFDRLDIRPHFAKGH